MKKWLSILLAAVLVAATSVVGFAYTSVEAQGVFLQFDTGNKNYSFPVDFSGFSDYYKEKFLSRDHRLIFRFSSNANGSFISVFSCLKTAEIKFSSVRISSKVSFTCSADTAWSADFSYNPGKECFVLYGTPSTLGSSTTFPLGGSYYPGTMLYVPDLVVDYHDTCNVMLANSVSLVDINAPSEKLLTINYQYSNGTPAADSATQSLAPGAEYSIPSPDVAGYTPDLPLVTGTMPEEDLAVTVTYTKAFYPLTVRYQYANGSQAAESVSFQYPLGFAYDIPSPEIPGYRPDKPAIAGEMPGEALEEIVTYSAIPYTLTVRYHFLDGSQAAPDHQEQLIIGSSYFVASPEIAGYHPNQTAVSGVMPAGDVISTVTYREDSGGETPDPGGGEEGPGEGGGEGPGGGSLGDDPFGIPVQPPFSGYDPFKIGGLPSWSGNDPFKIDGLPPYTYDPFVMPKQ